jgi:hypothetical protein
MHRPTIGAITVALFVIALVLWMVEPQGDNTLALACVRVGIIMGVLWLALPQLLLLPRWIVLIVVGAVAVVCFKPKALLFALPVLVLLAVMRPRWGSKRSGRAE